jgi:amidohydrolase
MEDLISLRRELHANPELSGNERQTARRIAAFFQGLGPDQTIADLGGYGIAFVFNSRQAGPTVVFRCELDAIAVHEENDLAYRSQNPGCSHNCGHDGHMAIMARFGYLISQRRPVRGRIILVFQPAEETGQGAAAVVNDPRFKELNADFAFAMHNLPGYPLGAVVLKPGPMNCASRGMIARLSGVTSHAARPEDGVSPALAMSELIQGLARLPAEPGLSPPYGLVTVVHARLGEPAFGLSPGFAEVMATLRTESDDAMSILAGRASKLVKEKAASAGLGFDISWSDEFVASANDPGTCDMVRKAAAAAGLKVIDLADALRVSEDFGQFSSRIPGAMIGLGAGENCPGLHQADYDFPEQLIQIGSNLFMEIALSFQRKP